MKNISLKLQDQTLQETELIVEHLAISRNKYISEAIEFYNQYQKRKMLDIQLTKESKLVQEDSMLILDEFEKLEDEF